MIVLEKINRAHGTMRLLAVLGATSMAMSPAFAADGKLHLFTWANFFPQELLDDFSEETGIQVVEDNYNSNENLLAKVQAGNTSYDVAVPSDYMARIMLDEGLLAEVNASELPNFSLVDPDFTDPEYDPGSKHSIPIIWGTTSFAYDEAAVPEGVISDSWASYFEPSEELRGRIASIDDQGSVYRSAAIYLGVPQCTEDPAEAQRILDLLKGQKPSLLTYSSDGVADRLLSGEVAVSMIWSGRAHNASLQKPSIKYVVPSEGIEWWHDAIVALKSSEDLEEVKTFMDFMMRPESAAAMTNQTGYMNAIKGSEAFMRDDLVEGPAVNMPEELRARLNPIAPCTQAGQELRDKVWAEVRR